MKQTCKFVVDLPSANSEMLLHLVRLPLAHGIYQQYSGLARHISQMVPGSQLSACPEVGEFLDVLETAYIHKMKQQSLDPRIVDCPDRKIASYLSWIWDGRLHKRPKFYDLDLDARQYSLCLRTRFLESNLPVYHQVYKPFLDRVCPLCRSVQSGPCDLQHVLAECPYTLQFYNQALGDISPEALMFPRLLRSNDVDVWRYIATCLQLVLQRIKIRRRRINNDDD
jgi:hypothetical protein